MRSVVQRVSRALVTVSGETVGEIGAGLLVLVGITHDDQTEDSHSLADKIAGLRVFRDDAGLMNRSVAEVRGAILVVSQFTLYGDARRGRRPSFMNAAPPEVAEPLVTQMVDRIKAKGIDVAEGSFGASMEIELVNDGPVTLIIETSQGRVL